MAAQAHIELLGQTVRDRVSGLHGCVISVSFDLFGCVQAAVNPGLDKDGKYVNASWFDVNRLEVTNPNRVMPVPAFATAPAQFGATPQSHAHGPAERGERAL